jgi:hypothetical protein
MILLSLVQNEVQTYSVGKRASNCDIYHTGCKVIKLNGMVNMNNGLERFAIKGLFTLVTHFRSICLK